MNYSLTPDFYVRPSEKIRKTLSANNRSIRLMDDIERLPQDKSILMRLLNVYIKDNKEVLSNGEIYLSTVVFDSLSADPQLTQISQFMNVKDGQKLPIAESGYTIYRNNKLPDFLDYRILVMESDEEIRNLGSVLDEIRNNDEYKRFRDAILGATALSQPMIALCTAAADFVIGLVAESLKMNQDDQLIYIAGSFDRKFDEHSPLLSCKNDYANVYWSIEIED